MVKDMCGCSGDTTILTHDDTISGEMLEILLEHIDEGGYGGYRLGVYAGQHLPVDISTTRKIYP